MQEEKKEGGGEKDKKGWKCRNSKNYYTKKLGQIYPTKTKF